MRVQPFRRHPPALPRQHLAVATPVANERLRAQGGRFTLCRAPVASLEEYVEQHAPGVALTKCVLPAAAATRALPDLDAMGITSAELFADLGGTATLATMPAVLQSGLV